MRRKPLITHLEEELADEVKTRADHAGMTASAYIRKVLIDHTGLQPAPVPRKPRSRPPARTAARASKA